MARYYVTTPIYYINGLPHIGHVFTTVFSDVICRYHRLLGEDVYFLTGTDEHGQKAEKAAQEAGLTPLEMADRIVPNFINLWKRLNISNNDFIRTTEERHRNGVEELFRRSQANGDIYLGNYEGWYCTSDEAFFTEGQLVDGKCPDCGRSVERIQEPSYFFRLSRYQEPLLQYYRENPAAILPKSRYNEVVSFLEGGLKDNSISRLKLTWGIPVPGDPSHVIYVWFDALSNYVTALGFPSDLEKLNRYWPADVHVVGKDIIRFHAIYWPAFLLSAGLPPARRVYAHGWWLNEEQKISKSRGNVVEPNRLIDDFGTDALRYFLIREAPLEADSSYSRKSILRRVNSDLANDLGNLASRSLTMVQRYAAGKIPTNQLEAPAFHSSIERIVESLPGAIGEFAFPRMLAEIWEVINEMNRYIVEQEPWVLAKDASKRSQLEAVLYNTCEGLRVIAALLAPVIPSAADQIWKQLGLRGNASSATRADLRWGGLQQGTQIGEISAVFPRIEEKEEAEIEAQQPSQKAAVPVEHASIEDFQNLGLRVGEIKTAEKVVKSKKLLKLQVDLGTETRQLVAGIAEAYTVEELIGRQVIVVTNLKPAKLMGVESNGMILAASIDGKPVLASLTQRVPNGTIVK